MDACPVCGSDQVHGQACIATRLFKTLAHLGRGIRRADVAVVDAAFLKACGIGPHQDSRTQAEQDRGTTPNGKNGVKGAIFLFPWLPPRKRAVFSQKPSENGQGTGRFPRQEEEEPMSTYRRKNNREFNRYLAKLEGDLKTLQEETVQHQQAQQDSTARQKANVALFFFEPCAKAVEQHKNRSRLWWLETIAVEWLRQRAEALLRIAKRIGERTY